MKKSTKIVVIYTILAVACAVVIVVFLYPLLPLCWFNAEVLSSKPDEYIDIIDLSESDPYLEEAIANPGDYITVYEKSAYYQITISQEIFNVKVGDSYYYVAIIVDFWVLTLLPWCLLASIVLVWMILYIVHHRRELGRTI